MITHRGVPHSYAESLRDLQYIHDKHRGILEIVPCQWTDPILAVTLTSSEFLGGYAKAKGTSDVLPFVRRSPH